MRFWWWIRVNLYSPNKCVPSWPYWVFLPWTVYLVHRHNPKANERTFWEPFPRVTGEDALFLHESGSARSHYSLVAQKVKNPLVMQDPWVGKIPSPEGGRGNPLHYSCLENPHEQRSLVGYNPWDHKESNTSERLSTVQKPLSCHVERAYHDRVKQSPDFICYWTHPYPYWWTSQWVKILTFCLWSGFLSFATEKGFINKESKMVSFIYQKKFTAYLPNEQLNVPVQWEI